MRIHARFPRGANHVFRLFAERKQMIEAAGSRLPATGRAWRR
jgi:hypothetical protein